MESFLTRIKKSEPLVADGAMGSLLLERAGELLKDKCSEVINLSRTDILKDVASLYLAAGANILQTNTFGGSPLRLAEFSLGDKMEEINRIGVEAVLEIAAGKAFVSASVGPCGKMLKPFGTASPEEVADSFAAQLEVLAKAAPDIICVETMMDINEAVLAIKSAKSISKEIPVMATMTFDKKPKGFFTFMGVTIEKAAKELEAAGADVVGSNCGNGIENMILIAKEFTQHTKLPIIIQSNAGLPEVKDGTLTYPETPEFMAQKAKELADLGVSIIGGCCGTTPDHIRAIADVMQNK